MRRMSRMDIDIMHNKQQVTLDREAEGSIRAATVIAEELAYSLDPGTPRVVELTCDTTSGTFIKDTEKNILNPVNCRIHQGVIQICLDQNTVMDVSQKALQGWIEHEVTLSFLKSKPDKYRFNFSRQILPLIYVFGAARAYVRNIVEYIRIALLKYLVTAKLIELKRASSQMHYYFYRLGLQTRNQKEYVILLKHNWQRSFFLLRMLQNFSPIRLLDSAGICQGFQESFWAGHNFVRQDDRGLILQMAMETEQCTAVPFGDCLVAVFKVLNDNLLGG